MRPEILQLIYVAWCVLLAYINKGWIEQNYKIRHFFNGAAHLAFMWVCYSNFGWMIALAVPFLIRVVFDGTLSLFRGLSFDYVSPKPKSLVDKIEKKIFGMNGMLPKIIWLITATILNILYYATN